VLVTRTNSSVLMATFPSEKLIPEPHRRLLLLAGHIGRQWSPETTEVLGPGVMYGTAGPSAPYTLPALELRRVLERARLRREPFFLEYRRQRSRAWGPNTVANASTLTPQVRYEEDGSGGRWCIRLDTPAPCTCSPGEPVLLPAVGSSFMERLVLKLLLSTSYAVPPAGFPAQGVGCHNR